MTKQRYYIQVFGCQMNQAEAEQLAQAYQHRGWLPAGRWEKADEVVVHTCSVRQSAENRVYGWLQKVQHRKKESGKPRVILTGCLVRPPEDQLRLKMPAVDEFKKVAELLPKERGLTGSAHQPALVPITNGCDNFCSYCVVPSARGRENSRPWAEILCGVQALADKGVTEVVLLGQNVNSYGQDLSADQKRQLIANYSHVSYLTTNLFALLLQNLHQVEKIKRIAFLTSNPWDFSDDLITVLTLPKIDKHLHLPVQSGADQILRSMNRKYSAQEYLTLVSKIKNRVPGITFGTDIIVGYPGETDWQFNRTVWLCRQVGFRQAYIARYSPRPGTTAYRLEDDVPAAEKKRRWRVLEELING